MEPTMIVQTLTLDQCPPDIRAFFLSDPGYQAAVRVTKSSPLSTDTPAHVTKSLKTSRVQHVQKAANLPGFAAILAGSVNRNIGTPAPAIPKAPAPTTTPTDAVLTRANAGGSGLTTRGANTPKEPASTLAASRGNVVEYKDLQTALNAAMAAQHIQRQHEAFNEKRSAFARIHKSTAPDTPSGTGSAWNLRNASGKLVQSVLGAVTRKADTPLPANSAWRPMTGASLK